MQHRRVSGAMRYVRRPGAGAQQVDLQPVGV